MTTLDIVLTVVLGLAAILWVGNQVRVGLHRGPVHDRGWRNRRRRKTEPTARP